MAPHFFAPAAEATQADVRLPRLAPQYQQQSTSEDASTLLWRSAPLGSTSTNEQQLSERELRQGIRAFVVADPALSELYSLRQLFKGTSQKTWKLTESAAGELRLEVGAQSLPVFKLSGLYGRRAAVGLTTDSIGVYSTKPLTAANSALQEADAALGDAASHDQSELHWISARPFQTPQGAVELIYLQGTNDLTPNSPHKARGKLVEGSMAGAKVAYALPLSWKVEGEWLTSRIGPNEPDEAYVVALAGPVAHPWGETGVRFTYRETGADFQTFSGTPADAGYLSKQLSLQQPFRIGEVTGSLDLNWAQREAAAPQHTPEVPTEESLQAASSLRWQATSDITLTAAHKIGNNVTERDSLDPTITSRQNSQSTLGVEWKVAPSLSLLVGRGETRYDESVEAERLLHRLGKRDQHYSVGVRGQTAGTSVQLQLQRRNAFDVTGEATAQADTLALTANQDVATWLRLGGTYRFTQNEGLYVSSREPATDLTARAAFSLQELGSVELRYMQANSDGVRLNDDDRAYGYGVRYFLGAKPGQAGFGLSVDYSYRKWDAPTDQQWRLGLTYR